MVEYHGWITIKLAFKADEQSNDDDILKFVNSVNRRIAE